MANSASVGVIGAGHMGCGIAEVCARAGASVLVFEPDNARLSAGRKRIAASLLRAVSRGKLTSTVLQVTVGGWPDLPGRFP
jgi:3-hydroxybutyryl-CoA dehydrogenase